MFGNGGSTGDESGNTTSSDGPGGSGGSGGTNNTGNDPINTLPVFTSQPLDGTYAAPVASPLTSMPVAAPAATDTTQPSQYDPLQAQVDPTQNVFALPIFTQQPVNTSDFTDPTAQGYAISLSPTERDMMVRTVAAEADATPDSRAAVAAVILNRASLAGGTDVLTGRSYPSSVSGVITQRHQFEGYGNANYNAIQPTSATYNDISNTIDGLLSGAITDPTQGATAYYSPPAQAALGRPTPSWATAFENNPNVTSETVGTQRFYAAGLPIQGSVAGNQPSLSPFADYNAPPALGAYTATPAQQPLGPQSNIGIGPQNYSYNDQFIVHYDPNAPDHIGYGYGTSDTTTPPAFAPNAPLPSQPAPTAPAPTFNPSSPVAPSIAAPAQTPAAPSQASQPQLGTFRMPSIGTGVPSFYTAPSRGQAGGAPQVPTSFQPPSPVSYSGRIVPMSALLAPPAETVAPALTAPAPTQGQTLQHNPFTALASMMQAIRARVAA